MNSRHSKRLTLKPSIGPQPLLLTVFLATLFAGTTSFALRAEMAVGTPVKALLECRSRFHQFSIKDIGDGTLEIFRTETASRAILFDDGDEEARDYMFMAGMNDRRSVTIQNARARSSAKAGRVEISLKDPKKSDITLSFKPIMPNDAFVVYVSIETLKPAVKTAILETLEIQSDRELEFESESCEIY